MAAMSNNCLAYLYQDTEAHATDLEVETAREVAIEIIHVAGFTEGSALDSYGSPVGDVTQTLLMMALMRMGAEAAEVISAALKNVTPLKRRGAEPVPAPVPAPVPVPADEPAYTRNGTPFWEDVTVTQVMVLLPLLETDEARMRVVDSLPERLYGELCTALDGMYPQYSWAEEVINRRARSTDS